MTDPTQKLDAAFNVDLEVMTDMNGSPEMISRVREALAAGRYAVFVEQRIVEVYAESGYPIANLRFSTDEVHEAGLTHLVIDQEEVEL